MPYRSLILPSDSGPQVFFVRVSDAAVSEWLTQRDSLRTSGYPDRPPDVDTPELRAWVPWRGEQMLPYFQRETAAAPDVAPAAMFGVYTCSWGRIGGGGVKLIVTGADDGAFLSRVVIEDATGECREDMSRLCAPDEDPDAAWTDIERVLRFIAETIPDAAPRDARVTTYLDFLAVDAELEAAMADVRAAGLLAGSVH